MRLLVLGGTGAVGQAVLQRALADSRMTQVIAPTRRPLPAHAKLENPIIEYDQLSGQESWWKADGGICCLGITIAQAKSRAAFRKVDFDHIVHSAIYARRNGVLRFGLTSSLWASPHAPSFYLKTKGEVEEALKDLNFSSLTIVRPSMIDAHREKPRVIESAGLILLRLFDKVIPEAWKPVTPEAIAHALIENVLSTERGVRFISNQQLRLFC